MTNIDRFRGCLIGGAAGDALGYEVEFMPESSIFSKFGPGGITEYALHRGRAMISDDTQMTLFTANGVLLAAAMGKLGDVTACRKATSQCYREWLLTQDGVYPVQSAKPFRAWLMDVRELYSPRAPGNTCLSALRQGGWGSVDGPINGSAGCGGVMRAAPAGLICDPDREGLDHAARLGAECAAITHGHDLGWLPAATLACAVSRLAYGDVSVAQAVSEALDVIDRLYDDAPHLPFFEGLVKRALRLARTADDDLSAIHELGEGWKGDEALAIAVYCAARYQDDFDRAMIASVNHKGDSDSTGAITGNLVGARLGLAGIPEKYQTDLELRDTILTLADDLFLCATGGDGWRTRYEGR